MKVFIGSSSKSLDITRKIASIIQKDGYTPEPWQGTDVFRPSRFIFQSIEEAADRFDAAIFVFNEDDKIIKDGEGDIDYFTVRDNVLIEYGYFAGALGRDRVLVCVSGRPKIASDLAGLLNVDLNFEYAAEIKILNFLKSINPLKDIERVLLDTGKGPFLTFPSPPSSDGGRKTTLTNDMDLAMELMQVVGEKYFPKFGTKFDSNTDGLYGSEIHYGTPAISNFVNRYISMFIKGFKWRITKHNFVTFNFASKEKEMFDSSIIEKVEDGDWEGFSFSNEEFPYIHEVQDYAFLLRLGKEHFPAAPRTVHVLFSIGEYGIKAALEHFLYNLATIHEQFPSNDYLLVAKVGRGGVLKEAGFNDIYKKVFESKNN